MLSTSLYYKGANELKISSHLNIYYPPSFLPLRSAINSDPTYLNVSPDLTSGPGRNQSETIYIYPLRMPTFRNFSSPHLAPYPRAYPLSSSPFLSSVSLSSPSPKRHARSRMTSRAFIPSATVANELPERGWLFAMRLCPRWPGDSGGWVGGREGRGGGEEGVVASRRPLMRDFRHPRRLQVRLLR